MTDQTARATASIALPTPTRLTGHRGNVSLFDRIWHVTGSLALAPGQSNDEVFDRLDPLFNQAGTSHERADGVLTFRKRDQAAQDKMAIYDGGTLRIEHGAGGPMLSWRLRSRALLLCFLAPLLFLAFAQFSVLLNQYEKPTPAEVAAKKKKAEEQEKKNAERQLHPIDQFLGAPAPDKPKKDDKAKDESEEAEEKHSPIPAYAFAGIFAALYVAGRVIEDRRTKRLFRKTLLGA